MPTPNDTAFAVSHLALAVFVYVNFVVKMVLVLDVILFANGLPTITEKVWSNPILIIPLVAFNHVGTVSLAVHFLVVPR